MAPSITAMLLSPKFQNNGSNLVYFTYLGGRVTMALMILAVDGAGNAYITGFTDSTIFPVVPAGGIPGLPHGTNISGTLITNNNINISRRMAFVAELGTNGTSLIFQPTLAAAPGLAGAIALDAATNFT